MVTDTTLGIYPMPMQLVDDISALRLGHIGFGIPAGFMSPFVTVCVEVVQGATKDNEGATFVMNAIHNFYVNCLKEAPRALAESPSERTGSSTRRPIPSARP